MSEKIPAEFVTDWKKIRYWLWACRRGDEFCARSLSENKSENRNENLTATAKKSKYTTVYIVVRDNIPQK